MLALLAVGWEAKMEPADGATVLGAGAASAAIAGLMQKPLAIGQGSAAGSGA